MTSKHSIPERYLLYSDQKKGQGDMRRSLYNFIFEKKIILSGYRGSIAHNLHIPQEQDETFGIGLRAPSVYLSVEKGSKYIK